MTREEAIAYGERVIGLGLNDETQAFCEMSIKALEQQPCEDAISREAVDEYITNLLSGYLYDEERTRLEDLTAYIWELPSVTPQSKIGKWIVKEGFDGDEYYDCSECGESFCLIDGTPADNLYNYCPNCGAKLTELNRVKTELEESEGEDDQ